jgi:hypothetical protein
MNFFLFTCTHFSKCVTVEYTDRHNTHKQTENSRVILMHVQDAGTWFLRSVWTDSIICSNQIDQINQMNQTN